MGALCAAVGAGVGLYLGFMTGGGDYRWFPLPAGLAAFAAGATFWRLLAGRGGAPSIRRGVVAGSLAGLISHYLCWYLLILGSNVCHWTTGGCTSSLGEPPIDPINGLWGAAVLATGSLLVIGWLTIPAGALIGGALAASMRARFGGNG